MWDSDKQRRLNDLRRQEQRQPLTDEEQQELDRMLHELEQAEWVSLRPGLDRLRHEQAQLQADLGQLQAQNAVLAALTERYDDLLARARAQLTGLLSEREALRDEYERVLHQISASP